MRFALSLMTIALLAGPARAQALPEFDSLRACTDRTPLGATGVSGITDCVFNEELQAEALRVDYPRLPPAVRATCERYAIRVANGWGSYALLSDCLRDKYSHKSMMRMR